MAIDPLTLMTIGSGVNVGGNILSTYMQNKHNKQMAEYAYTKDLEMWNRQNEYNNPINQMNRLKNAGLNPNLVYGNGAVGNTGSTIPHYQAPHLEKPDLNIDMAEVISMYNQVKMNEAQVDNIKKQNDLLELRKASEAIDLENKKWLNDQKIPGTVTITTPEGKTVEETTYSNLVRQGLKADQKKKLYELGYTDKQIQLISDKIALQQQINPLLVDIKEEEKKQASLKTGAMEFGDTLREYGVDANSSSTEKLIAFWLDKLIKMYKK